MVQVVQLLLFCVSLRDNLLEQTLEDVDVPVDETLDSWWEGRFGIQHVHGRLGQTRLQGLDDGKRSGSLVGGAIQGTSLGKFFVGQQPVRLHFTFSFGDNGIGTAGHPVGLSSGKQKFRRLMGQVDLVTESRTFDASGCIDGITEQLESRFISTQDTGCDGSTVDSDSQVQISSIGSEEDFELGCKCIELSQTLTSKFTHDDGMILDGFWQTGNRHVTISNRLDFKDLSALCCLIESLVDGFEQGKDLTWFPYRTPGGKSRNVSKEDGRIWEQIGNRFGFKNDVLGSRGGGSRLFSGVSFLVKVVLETELLRRSSSLLHGLFNVLGSDTGLGEFVLGISAVVVVVVVVIKETVPNFSWKETGHNGIGSCQFGHDLSLLSLDEIIVHDEKDGCEYEQHGHDDGKDGRHVGTDLLFDGSRGINGQEIVAD
mmetsp:Transcript_28119/g.52774  ORF Transcript_28119/g.52774 Transcript_28119/m.52774 type:complete len:428 (-) Transcript_28119:325-1608(-)